MRCLMGCSHFTILQKLRLTYIRYFKLVVGHCRVWSFCHRVWPVSCGQAILGRACLCFSKIIFPFKILYNFKKLRRNYVWIYVLKFVYASFRYYGVRNCQYLSVARFGLSKKQKAKTYSDTLIFKYIDELHLFTMKKGLCKKKLRLQTVTTRYSRHNNQNMINLILFSSATKRLEVTVMFKISRQRVFLFRKRWHNFSIVCTIRQF